jgi:hypothetical protein
MIEMTSAPGRGGLWGREGVHPGQRSDERTTGFHHVVLIVWEYTGEAAKSQENTLRNDNNIV